MPVTHFKKFSPHFSSIFISIHLYPPVTCCIASLSFVSKHPKGNPLFATHTYEHKSAYTDTDSHKQRIITASMDTDLLTCNPTDIFNPFDSDLPSYAVPEASEDIFFSLSDEDFICQFDRAPDESPQQTAEGPACPLEKETLPSEVASDQQLNNCQNADDSFTSDFFDSAFWNLDNLDSKYIDLIIWWSQHLLHLSLCISACLSVHLRCYSWQRPHPFRSTDLRMNSSWIISGYHSGTRTRHNIPSKRNSGRREI